MPKRRRHRRKWAGHCLLAVGVTLALASPGKAAEKPAAPDSFPPEHVEFFEKTIRPLLVANCQKCHGPEEAKSGLRIDSRAALLQGGESGPAIVPGSPEEGLLIDAVRYGDVYQMPPTGKLRDAEVANLVEWVRLGAPWGVESSHTTSELAAERKEFSAEERSFWAFQPLRQPVLPAVKDTAWPKNDLDLFVLAQLEAQGLRPARAADRRTLLRRVTYDLLGLPPTPEETAEFLADESPEAFARVVERLLASPRYGERWGRHWLDVARYSDSNGMDENLAFVNAFRYRDYVIRALNSDKPFDEFVCEQLAGDLLPTTDPAQQLDRIVATGFLVIGPKMLAEDDPVKMQMDIVDEQVDTVGQAFLGLTLGCARCHDHKFDPIRIDDYYALAGIFKSTHTMDNHRVVAQWHERPLASDADLKKLADHQRSVQTAQQEVDQLIDTVYAAQLAEALPHTADYLLLASRLRSLPPLRSMIAQQATLPSDSLVIEAENFVRGNLAIHQQGYGEGIGVLVNQDAYPNFAEYEIEVAAGGTFQLELRYAAAEARPIGISINGNLVEQGAASAVTGSWNPDGQQWHAELVVELGPGKNLIRLERDGPFPHLDKFACVPAALPAECETLDYLGVEAAARRAGLNSIFAAQWIAFLDRVEQQADSIFQRWIAQLKDHSPEEVQSEHDSLAQALGLDRLPHDSRALAERYQTLFLAAHDSEDASGDVAAPVIESFRQVLIDKSGPWARSEKLSDTYPSEVKVQLAGLRETLAATQQSAPRFDHAMAVADSAGTNLQIHLRGNHLTLGEEVPRRFPRILCAETPEPLTATSSGRLELARWLTDGKHPLTSRVLANRVWRWHFGTGIVNTPDNFGLLGSRPTNQALLDYLAIYLQEHGWSLKQLHRAILLSSTYQMSTDYCEAAQAHDPENQLLWRRNRRRLEGEVVRDALLAISCQLDTTMFGQLLTATPRQYVSGTGNGSIANYASPRRSVYLPVIRSALYDVFQAFDFADPSTLHGDRAETTVPPQALFMLNSELMLSGSESLARRVLEDGELDDRGRVRRLYELAYTRPANDQEIERALTFVAHFRSAWERELPQDSSLANVRAWQGLCQSLLAAHEFLYIE